MVIINFFIFYVNNYISTRGKEIGHASVIWEANQGKIELARAMSTYVVV